MKIFGGNARGHLQEEGLEALSLSYLGWRIEILASQSEFVFQCYPPDLQDFIDAGESYPDRETALHAAHYFVDREIAIRAILDVVNEWFWRGLISEEEYWNLTSFS